MLFTRVHYGVNRSNGTYYELEVLAVAEQIVVARCCQSFECHGLFLCNGDGHIEEELYIGVYLLHFRMTNTKAIQQFRRFAICFLQ